MTTHLNLAEFLDRFKERSGFGITGAALDSITGYLNERIPTVSVRINIPYHDFNVRGKVSDVHRDVYGVMPFNRLYGDRSKVVDAKDTTTLFYGEERVGCGFIPFLSDCDVYFIEECDYTPDGTLVVDLKKGPNWRMYL